jgi:hypothetical protein
LFRYPPNCVCSNELIRPTVVHPFLVAVATVATDAAIRAPLYATLSTQPIVSTFLLLPPYGQTTEIRVNVQKRNIQQQQQQRRILNISTVGNHRRAVSLRLHLSRSCSLPQYLSLSLSHLLLVYSHFPLVFTRPCSCPDSFNPILYHHHRHQKQQQQTTLAGNHMNSPPLF